MMRYIFVIACLALLACGTAVASEDGESTRVGIVPFGYSGSDARWISEKLFNELKNNFEDSEEYSFISKDDLKDAFEDLGFNPSDFEYGVPSSFVANAGIALGADMILYGNISPSGEEFMVLWNVCIPVSGNTVNADPAFVPKNTDPVRQLAGEMVSVLSELIGGRIQQALDQAAFSIQMKNWSMAIMFLKQVLSVDPTLLDANFQLAGIYLEPDVDSVNMAMQIYETILNTDESNADALAGLGSVYLAQNDAETAKTYFESAVDIDPENADAYLGLASAYQALGELDQAVSSFEEALAQNPDNLSIKFPLSLLYFQLGEYSQAIPYMEEILALNSNMVGLRQRIVQSYIKVCQYGNAADHAVILLEFDSGNSQMILYTAQVESWAGRTSSAVNRLESLISSTGNREAYILLASIYRDSGQRGSMQSVFSRLSNAYPNDPLANYMMGAFYYQSGSNKARISELIPENISTWQSAIGDLNNAISYLSQVTGYRYSNAQNMVQAACNSISLCEEKIDRVERYSQ